MVQREELEAAVEDTDKHNPTFSGKKFLKNVYSLRK